VPMLYFCVQHRVRTYIRFVHEAWRAVGIGQRTASEFHQTGFTFLPDGVSAADSVLRRPSRGPTHLAEKDAPG